MKHLYNKKESTYRIVFWTMIGLVVLMVGFWIWQTLADVQVSPDR